MCMSYKVTKFESKSQLDAHVEKDADGYKVTKFESKSQL